MQARFPTHHGEAGSGPREVDCGNSKPKRVEGRSLEDPPRTWVDLWALLRHDHGISWEEFQNLTLANIEALEYRRNVQQRHDRFNAGLIASSIINVNIVDGKHVEPFDFIPGFEPTADATREGIKHGIAVFFARLPETVTPEVVQKLKQRTIDRLHEQGIADAEELVNEVFQ